jgi:hypothetical protein
VTLQHALLPLWELLLLLLLLLLVRGGWRLL